MTEQANPGLCSVKLAELPSEQAREFCALLAEQGVPFVAKSGGAGDYFKLCWGFSNLGEKIWVSEADQARAQALLDGMDWRQPAALSPAEEEALAAEALAAAAADSDAGGEAADADAADIEEVVKESVSYRRFFFGLMIAAIALPLLANLLLRLPH